jgi:hypothetical protein
LDRTETKKVLENAVKVATLIIPDMEELLGIQAKIMWSFYNQVKNEGFTDDQARLVNTRSFSNMRKTRDLFQGN